MEVYLVTRPEHVEYVLITNGDNSLRGRDFEIVAKLAGSSILTTEGNAWRRLRRISQPAFHKESLEGMRDAVVHIADDMLKKWDKHVESGAPLDVAAEMMSVTMRVSGMLMCGQDLAASTSELGAAVSEVLAYVADSMASPFKLPTYVPTPANRRLKD